MYGTGMWFHMRDNPLLNVRHWTCRVWWHKKLCKKRKGWKKLSSTHLMRMKISSYRDDTGVVPYLVPHENTVIFGNLIYPSVVIRYGTWTYGNGILRKTKQAFETWDRIHLKYRTIRMTDPKKSIKNMVQYFYHVRTCWRVYQEWRECVPRWRVSYYWSPGCQGYRNAPARCRPAAARVCPLCGWAYRRGCAPPSAPKTGDFPDRRSAPCCRGD